MLCNFIKKLFGNHKQQSCDHDWRCVEENFYGATFECSKCGKLDTYYCGVKK